VLEALVRHQVTTLCARRPVADAHPAAVRRLSRGVAGSAVRRRTAQS
jgi:hypothetical protein